jgi:AraC family transcriptional regulator, regulatory protein of adaptative response / DNA-3-methyladenine glycosylase II
MTTLEYSGVRTTGIYCRPGCGGRPLAKNVTPYRSAAAAEAAGLRACFQCRPYRVSDLESWVDGPELVCRAIRLIIDGYLDQRTETALAAHLGVSARHLRRLFAEQVGATPDQVARSRRAHFARRLLDDTDLSLTDVAFAAGFGSVRQFNRAMQDTFRASPRELRERRRKDDRLTADGGLLLRLPFTPPLDWPSLLAWFGGRAIDGAEVVDGTTYRRTIVVDGDPGVIEVSPGGEDFLLLRAHLPHWDGLIHVVQQVRRMFGLDHEPADERFADDPMLAAAVADRPGLRVPGSWDGFEVGVRAILGQQVTVTGARTLAGRLVQRLGTPVPGLGELGLTHTFPLAATVADDDLDGVGLTGARVEALQSFAAAVRDGDVRLDGSVSLDDFVTSVIALPGLGDWTAQYLALRLGEPDAFPAGDLGLRKALGNGTVPTAREVAARAEAWRPWRAQAAIHLWALRP